MTKRNGSLALACLGLLFGGCAADVEGEHALTDVDSEAQALTEARLLALGDSIAFGYNPFGDFSDDKNFVGYPEVLKSDYAVKNASCPGETSKSLYDSSAPDNGCKHYRASYPLHVNYAGSMTQLDYALTRLTSSDPGDKPTLITLNVSGNDIFLQQAACASDPNPSQCFSNAAPGLIGSIAQNVGTILSRIRGVYSGRIVYQTLYTTDYGDMSATQFVTALNGAVANVAHQAGAQIADGYNAFKTAAGSKTPCDAGLLIETPDNSGCDVHPTLAGQQVLAQSVRDAQ